MFDNSYIYLLISFIFFILSINHFTGQMNSFDIYFMCLFSFSFLLLFGYFKSYFREIDINKLLLFCILFVNWFFFSNLLLK